MLLFYCPKAPHRIPIYSSPLSSSGASLPPPSVVVAVVSSASALSRWIRRRCGMAANALCTLAFFRLALPLLASVLLLVPAGARPASDGRCCGPHGRKGVSTASGLSTRPGQEFCGDLRLHCHPDVYRALPAPRCPLHSLYFDYCWGVLYRGRSGGP